MSGPKESNMKIVIRGVFENGQWRWLNTDEICGICGVPTEASCPDCMFVNDNCPLVCGQCSHCFHNHCIMKLLKSQSVHHQCPTCHQEWKIRE